MLLSVLRSLINIVAKLGDLRSIMKDRIETRQLHPLCHIVAHLHATDEPGADGRTGHRRIRGPNRLSKRGHSWMLTGMTSESRKQGKKEHKEEIRNIVQRKSWKSGCFELQTGARL